MLLAWRSSPSEVAAAFRGWPTDGAGAVLAFKLVTGGSWALVVRDCLLLIAVPCLALSRPLGRLAAGLSMATVLIAYCPPLGGLMTVALGQTVWRLYYILPVPLCFALASFLLMSVVAKPKPERSRLLPQLAVPLLIAIVWASHFSPVFTQKNEVELKPPLAYRFPAGVREFIDSAGPLIGHGRVLAPEQVSVALGLTRFATIDLVSPRPGYFHDERRDTHRRANLAISKCRFGKQLTVSLRELVEQDVDFLVTAACDNGTAKLAGHLTGFELSEVLAEGGYQLYSVRRIPNPLTAGSKALP